MDQLEFIARAIQDQDFRARLKANPEQVLKEAGSDLEGTQFKVVENTADTLYVAMPTDPNASISDDRLSSVAGGFRHVSVVRKPSSLATMLSTTASLSAYVSKMQDKNTGSS